MCGDKLREELGSQLFIIGRFHAPFEYQGKELSHTYIILYTNVQIVFKNLFRLIGTSAQSRANSSKEKPFPGFRTRIQSAHQFLK